MCWTLQKVFIYLSSSFSDDLITYRNIEEIHNDVPWVELDQLKGFVGLETEADIQEWCHKCETSAWKAVRDAHSD